MTGNNPFRHLAIRNDETRDAAGRGYGDDWTILDCGEDADGVRHRITTDRLRASEVGDLFPLSTGATVRWLVGLANRAYQDHGPDDWQRMMRFAADAYMPPPEPPPSWTQWRGAEWASDGHVAIRRGVEYRSQHWKAVTAAMLDTALPASTDPGEIVVTTAQRVVLRAASRYLVCDRRFEPVLRLGQLHVPRIGPVVVRDGVGDVAMVMPMMDRVLDEDEVRAAIAGPQP